MLGFANAVTNPIFLGRLGWSDVAHYRIWARPVVRRRSRRAPARSTSRATQPTRWRNHVVRDERYLSWRYVDSPRPYVTVRSDDGYAVVWPAKPFGSRTIAVLADLVAPREGGARPAAPGGRSGAVAADVRPAGARAARRLRRAGFVPTHLTMHLIGKGLNGPLDLDPAAWRFTLGDADFF